MPEATAPTEVTNVTVRGLRTCLYTWEVPDGAEPKDGTVLLLHGFADTAASFDLVASALASRGRRVVAPDLRGFGETEWLGKGGYYHFPDYVADVVSFVEQLDLPRLSLMGHSMGATVAAMVGALRPDRFEKVVLAEGLGLAVHPHDAVPDRFNRWLSDLATHAARPENRGLGDLAAATNRLRSYHPAIAREILATRAPLLTRDRGDGVLVWKFDPLHRTTAPMPFMLELFRHFVARLTMPVLVVGGGPEGFHTDDEAERMSWMPRARKVDLPGAGHMMHWTQPARFAEEVASFLDEP